jgi:hypothetical protein
VDDVRSEGYRLALAERFGAGGLDPTSGITSGPPPEDIVLAACVDADDGLHPMVSLTIPPALLARADQVIE